MQIDDIVRDRETKAMLGGSDRLKAEEILHKIQDVTEKTLEQDTNEAARDAAEELRSSVKGVLPPEITENPELMEYVVKGSQEEWDSALDQREVRGGEVLIKSGAKRKTQDVAHKEEGRPDISKQQRGKKKKKKRK